MSPNANVLTWLGHGSTRIEGEKIIYVDPWKLTADTPKADLILVTHSHHDHWSPDDIAAISTPRTTVITPPDCQGARGHVQVISPGNSISIDGIAITALPAYNTNKPFHPRANNWVAYLVEIGGQRFFFSGDSDAVPEMAAVSADVAIVAIGGTYTMDAREAAELVNRMKPGRAVPVHWGSIVGTSSDAELFKSYCQVPVDILPVST